VTHRTPSYVVDRLRLLARTKARPEEPWWTGGAVALVDRWLTRDDVVVEFGSGRSTRWLAERAARVVSIEHHEQWHEKVSRELADLDNAEVRRVEDEPGAYAAAADDVEGVSFVVVDGKYRDMCAQWAIGRIGPGGAILLDDSQRYLDRDPRFTKRTVPKAPERGALWDELAAALGSWRQMTYCDGVSDTTLLTPRV